MWDCYTLIKFLNRIACLNCLIIMPKVVFSVCSVKWKISTLKNTLTNDQNSILFLPSLINVELQWKAQSGRHYVQFLCDCVRMSLCGGRLWVISCLVNWPLLTYSSVPLPHHLASFLNMTLCLPLVLSCWCWNYLKIQAVTLPLIVTYGYDSWLTEENMECECQYISRGLQQNHIINIMSYYRELFH